MSENKPYPLKIGKVMSKKRTKKGVRYYPMYHVFLPVGFVRDYGLTEEDLVYVIPLKLLNENDIDHLGKIMNREVSDAEHAHRTAEEIVAKYKTYHGYKQLQGIEEVITQALAYWKEGWSLSVKKRGNKEYLYAQNIKYLGPLTGQLKEKLRHGYKQLQGVEPTNGEEVITQALAYWKEGWSLSVQKRGNKEYLYAQNIKYLGPLTGQLKEKLREIALLHKRS